MANVKITELTAYTNPASTDVVPIVDLLNDQTKKVTLADIFQNSPDGTAAAPGIAFDDDSNTGIYRPGADQLALATNGTGRLFIDSSGNVGVLKSSPNAPLDINLAADRGIQATASVSSPSFVRSYQGEVSNNIRDIGLQGYTIRFETGPNTGSTTTEAARIDSAGRLLVGTSTSVATSVGQPPIQVTTGQSIIRYSSTGSFPAVLDICHSKSNTIGTNTSLGDGDAIGRISYGGADGSSYVAAARVEAFVDGTPGTDDMPGRLVFSTTADGASSPTERMRITNEGDLWLGQTTAAGPGYGNPTTGLGFDGSIKTLYVSASTNPALRLNVNYDGGIVDFRRSGSASPVGSIAVTTTSTAYNTSSDYRLKENVVSLTGAADRLNQLQVHRFNFIADPDATVDGFLAHEAQSVVPECVTGTKDEVDDEGNPVYQGIDQSKLVPLLTAALQESLGRIETLEAEVAALKAS